MSGPGDAFGDDDVEDALISALAEQYRAAIRLDGSARVLAAIAWVVGFLLAAGAIIGGVAIGASSTGDSGTRILEAVGVVDGGLAFAGWMFVASYLMPAWARSFAAGQQASALRNWPS